MEDPKPRKLLRQKMSELKMARRTGAYVPNQNKTGIVKASPEVQRVFRKNLKQKMRELRGGVDPKSIITPDPLVTSSQSTSY